MSKYAVLVDYEYCTGCHACEVACKQEHGRAAGKVGGIRILDMTQELPGGKVDVTYLPIFTRLCSLCLPRVKKGLSPACVKHCMAQCLKFGDFDDLSKETPKKRGTVLWSR